MFRRPPGTAPPRHAVRPLRRPAGPPGRRPRGLEDGLEPRLGRGEQRPAAQTAGEAGGVLPAVPLRLRHQLLQPAVPGVLGRRRPRPADHRPAGDGPADRRSQRDGEPLFRPRRRRAVHAPGPAGDPEAAPGLLLPDLHQRPVHHRRKGGRDAAAGERHPADLRRGRRDRVGYAPRPHRRAEQDDAGRHELPREQGPHGRLHERLRPQLRRAGERRLARQADRPGRALHLVPRLPPDGAGRRRGPVPLASSKRPCGSSW